MPGAVKRKTVLITVGAAVAVPVTSFALGMCVLGVVLWRSSQAVSSEWDVERVVEYHEEMYG